MRTKFFPFQEDRLPQRRVTLIIKIFFFSAFLLLSLRDNLEWQGLALALLVPLLFQVATVWLAHLYSSDKLLLCVTNFLCALGILVLYVTDRGAGTTRGLQQAIYYGIGILVMILCMALIKHLSAWRIIAPALLIISIGLQTLPLLFGREFNGATNWIYIGGTSLQPSEICKISFLLVMAYYLSTEKVIPWLALLGGTLLLLMLQKDLGTALVFYLSGLLMFYCANGSLLWTGVGILGGCGAAVAGYQLFAHVKKRVAIWLNPWQYSSTSGYQIVQALMAIASGGFFGVGLGLGTPRVIPIYYADCIFAVICEQFGVIFGALVIVMYVILILRGVRIGMQAQSAFLGLTAIGATAMLGLQTFIIIGGVMKLIPLTGVTMPFVSYGGSSLVSCMGLIGLLQGISSKTQDALAFEMQVSHVLQTGSTAPVASEEVLL